MTEEPIRNPNDPKLIESVFEVMALKSGRRDNYAVYQSDVDQHYYAVGYDDGDRLSSAMTMVLKHSCPEKTPEWPHCWEHVKAIAHSMNVERWRRGSIEVEDA